MDIMIKNTKSDGFTLVEMAIVLVIGGMMLGAVMKGQTMIETFKLQRLMHDLKSINIAYITYLNMYNALPGDDARDHGWTGVRAGDSDGWIESSASEKESETHGAWRALRWAGILRGNPAAAGNAILPDTPYGGKYYFGNRHFGARIGKRNCVEVYNIAGNLAESIDIKFDDGIFDAGIITASKEYIDGHVDLYYAL
jgi:prepilin-type N-terminal cleavage/methylation domain-containing protein